MNSMYHNRQGCYKYQESDRHTGSCSAVECAANLAAPPRTYAQTNLSGTEQTTHLQLWQSCCKCLAGLNFITCCYVDCLSSKVPAACQHARPTHTAAGCGLCGALPAAAAAAGMAESCAAAYALCVQRQHTASQGVKLWGQGSKVSQGSEEPFKLHALKLGVWFWLGAACWSLRRPEATARAHHRAQLWQVLQEAPQLNPVPSTPDVVGFQVLDAVLQRCWGVQHSRELDTDLNCCSACIYCCPAVCAGQPGRGKVLLKYKRHDQAQNRRVWLLHGDLLVICLEICTEILLQREQDVTVRLQKLWDICN